MLNPPVISQTERNVHETLNPNNDFGNINGHYRDSYIAGLMDGDGCLCITATNQPERGHIGDIEHHRVVQLLDDDDDDLPYLIPLPEDIVFTQDFSRGDESVALLLEQFPSENDIDNDSGDEMGDERPRQ